MKKYIFIFVLFMSSMFSCEKCYQKIYDIFYENSLMLGKLTDCCYDKGEFYGQEESLLDYCRNKYMLLNDLFFNLEKQVGHCYQINRVQDSCKKIRIHIYNTYSNNKKEIDKLDKNLDIETVVFGNYTEDQENLRRLIMNSYIYDELICSLF